MNLDSHMEQIVDSYYCNEARKLHNMVDQILYKLHFIDVNKEDFYSLANEIFVVEVIPNYNPKKSFDAFLYSTLYKKFCTEMTGKTRFKRCRKIRIKEKNQDGNITVKTIIIPDESFDAPIGDDDCTTLKDLVASNSDVETEIFDNKEDVYSEKMIQYLNKLSNCQKKILKLIIAGYSDNEIKKELHITDKQYADNNAAIHSYRNVSVLF